MKVVVLSGAGVSAESGLKTFRDEDGLWEGHDVMEVATPEGFQKNPELVFEFYNQRRRQLQTAEPNDAHRSIAELESDFDVDVITQNVDDLHERAGSTKVLHLHGELFKARPVNDPNTIIDWREDLNSGDKDEHGNQLRPHVVWFGEAVPAMTDAVQITKDADILIIVGTSLQVYPAAGLKNYVRPGTPIYLVDPNPDISESKNLHIFAENASSGMQKIKRILLNSQ